jgi:hypothetical protein
MIPLFSLVERHNIIFICERGNQTTRPVSFDASISKRAAETLLYIFPRTIIFSMYEWWNHLRFQGKICVGGMTDQQGKTEHHPVIRILNCFGHVVYLLRIFN